MSTSPAVPGPATFLEQTTLIRSFEERSAASFLTNHRSAGHLLARGADPGRLMAEIMGRSTGYCGGKSGTLHVSAKELGVILTSTIVGGELSLAERLEAVFAFAAGSPCPSLDELTTHVYA